MTVWVAEEHAHDQSMVSVVKVTTVREEYTTEYQRSLVLLFLDKSTQCKGYSWGNFPVYFEKRLSHKVIHNGVEKFSQGRSKISDDTLPEAEMADSSQKTSMLRGLTNW
jgi:hypothetical protein